MNDRTIDAVPLTEMVYLFQAVAHLAEVCGWERRAVLDRAVGIVKLPFAEQREEYRRWLAELIAAPAGKEPLQ